MRHSSSPFATTLFAAAIFAGLAAGPARGDWPAYQHDSARSGVTPDEVRPPLFEQWTFAPIHPPDPAWSPPSPEPIEGIRELPRVRFDDAFQVAAAGSLVYFGSSADHTVYALDAASGEVRWRQITGGPVRLAPACWEGKVFVGSDDGHVWCFNARQGDLLWRFRAAPLEDRLLGRGRMLSLWPVRTGVLVDGGVAYFAAGIFPGEGLYLYAVRAADGELLWRNDTFGEGLREISPQGYLLASEDKLFVPSGRGVPAAFSRTDGRFLFQRPVNRFREGPYGGSDALLAGGHLYSGTEQILAFDTGSGSAGHAWFHGRRLVAAADAFYLASATELQAFDREEYPAASRERQELKHRRLDLTAARDQALQSQEAAAPGELRRLLEAAGAEADLERRRGAGAPAADVAAAEARVDEARKAVAEAKQREEDASRAVKKARQDLEALAAAEAASAARITSARRWRLEASCEDALILAARVLYAGGADRVLAVEAASGKELWRGRVEGRARGLAAAGGRLFVSTDRGRIHCFGPESVECAARRQPPVDPAPYGPDPLGTFYEAAARAIVEESGIRRGFALILGSGDGRLAFELARATELRIQAVEPDPTRAAAAREALAAAGLYGERVAVDQGTLEELPYADYFANLIVCQEAFSAGEISTPPEELLRLLKPLGGVAYVGLPGGGERPARPLEEARLRAWLEGLAGEGSLEGLEVHAAPSGAWARLARGALAGAGSWTHQYADPGNTTCGDDRLVKAPFGLLWFGEPGPARMVNRHASAAAPLSTGGRLFVEGQEVIMAYDAYNGLHLWDRELPGALRAGLKLECGNLAASGESLFVATGRECLRLAQDTGAVDRVYPVPPAPDGKRCTWGYVAFAEGLLYGSRTAGGRLADAVFAVDPESGAVRWLHQGREILHSTIALGGELLFVVDRGATEAQVRQALEGLDDPPRIDRKGQPLADVRVVVALDRATGEKRWERPMDFSQSVKVGRGGGELSAIAKDDVLLLFSAPWNGHFWTEFLAGEFSRRSLIALSARDGYPLWSGKVGYRSRPLVVGDTIYAEPWARNLRTGEPRLRADPLTGKESPWQMARPGHHCGCLAASPSCLFFRSESIGYYDLERDQGTAHFSGLRPGCWINFIPANGVLLVPEGSSGCVCPFPIHCTVAFKHRKEDRSWGMYSSAGAGGDLEGLAVNFGAPGDRKDPRGTLWLAYPRPRRDRLVFDLALETSVRAGGGYFSHDPRLTPVAGTDAPWVFTSGCLGLERCVVPLGGGDGPAGASTVRLYFAESGTIAPGERVFDVKLQGETVLQGLDVARESGGSGRALVKEFTGVVAGRDLVVELVSSQAASPERAPLLCGLEVIRARRHPAGRELAPAEAAPGAAPSGR